MITIIVSLSVLLICVTVLYVLRRALTLRKKVQRMICVRDCAAQWERDIHVGSDVQKSLTHSVELLTPDDRLSTYQAINMTRLGARVSDAIHTLNKELRNKESASTRESEKPECQRLLEYWALSQDYGIALAALLTKFLVDMDAVVSFYRRFQAALAGARLTVTVLVALPVGAVAIGESLGLATAHFLIGSLLGAVILVCGTIFLCVGVYWVEHLTIKILGGVGRRAGPLLDLQAARRLDIFSQALRSGIGIARSWRSSCCYEEDQLPNIAALVELGAGASAWEPLYAYPRFKNLARAIVHHYETGAQLVESIEYEAQRLRLEAEVASTAASEKTLVAIAAPLTLCFLPAFIILGLIPVVIGMATQG